jgi:peptidoglycan/LPS O-acetylase OafA/YrhL
VGWYTGHFWSLAVEEHFYLFWPFLLVLATIPRARYLAFILALIVPIWSLVDERFGWLSSLGHPSQRTDTRIDGLFWGCWVALLVDMPACKAWLTRWLSLWVWGGVVLALVALARYQPILETHWEAMLMPWLLLGTVLRPTTWAGRLLEAGPVRWVGRLSYSLYIWQQIFLLGSWKIVRPFPLGWLQELPLNLLAVFACAAASYYLVERPLLRMGQRLAKNYTVGKSAPTPAPAWIEGSLAASVPGSTLQA